MPITDQASIYVLAAGDVLLGTEILNDAKVRIQQQQHAVTASEATEIVRAAYQQARLVNIVQRELEPRGLSLDSYLCCSPGTGTPGSTDSGPSNVTG